MGVIGTHIYRRENKYSIGSHKPDSVGALPTSATNHLKSCMSICWGAQQRGWDVSSLAHLTVRQAV